VFHPSFFRRPKKKTGAERSIPTAKSQIFFRDQNQPTPNSFLFSSFSFRLPSFSFPRCGAACLCLCPPLLSFFYFFVFPFSAVDSHGHHSEVSTAACFLRHERPPPPLFAGGAFLLLRIRVSSTPPVVILFLSVSCNPEANELLFVFFSLKLCWVV